MNTLVGQSNHPNAATMPDDGVETLAAKGSVGPRSRDWGYTEANGLATGTADEQADDSARWQLQSLAALLELLNRIASLPTGRAASQKLADELQRYLGCEAVIVGLCRDGSHSCRVAAVSHVDRFHHHSPEIVQAQAAMQESIARSEITTWPAVDEGSRYGLKAHEQYAAARGVDVVMACPLGDATGQARAVCLVTGRTGRWDQEKMTRFFCAASTPIATTLRLITRAEAGRWITWSKRVFQQLRGRRGLVTLLLLVLAVAVMFLPVPFRVSCDGQLEPVTRRFVAVPFAGPLRESLVKPGNLVTEGQLLARMDGREIRWELAGVEAELFRATKQRAGHVASHAAGEAEMARHDIDRLRYREQLLKSRDQHLEIRSPVDGIIVSGDWQDSEGMPLEIGEVLFEVAPLEQMNVELAVPEDDMPFIQRGMPVRLVLDAFPMETYQSQVERIHPRAELVEGENVFVAEMPVENPYQKLLPGMRGRARIAAGHARIGWIVFRRPVAAIFAWLGW
jgi:hypothetical protein